MKAQLEGEKLTVAYSPRHRLIVFASIIGTMPLYMGIQFFSGTLHLADAIALSVAFLILVFGLFLSNPPSIFVFDRNSGQLKWKRKQIFGTEQGFVPLGDISDVSIETQSAGESTGSRIILIVNAKPLPITSECNQSLRKCEKAVDQIKEFLGLKTDRAKENRARALNSA